MAIVAVSEGASAAGAQAKEAAEALIARQQEVARRNLPTFDYEKVFFNSLFGVGLFGLTWFALKSGQAFIWIVDSLNSFGLTGWAIPDEPIAQMKRLGNALNYLDANFFIPYGPIIPLGIVAANSGLEYLRVRKGLGKNSKIAGDIIAGACAIAAAYAAVNAITAPDTSTLSPEAAEDVSAYLPPDYDPKLYRRQETYRNVDVFIANLGIVHLSVQTISIVLAYNKKGLYAKTYQFSAGLGTLYPDYIKTELHGYIDVHMNDLGWPAYHKY